jgi:hypothetical protein
MCKKKKKIAHWPGLYTVIGCSNRDVAVSDKGTHILYARTHLQGSAPGPASGIHGDFLEAPYAGTRLS